MNIAAQLLVLTDKIMNYRGTTALSVIPHYFYHYRGVTVNFFTIPTDHGITVKFSPFTAVLPRNYRFPHYRVTLSWTFEAAAKAFMHTTRAEIKICNMCNSLTG